MVNIILKNRKLIKIYKYSKIIFVWLNKHLYILSIFSIFKSFRKTIYYRIISYLTKLIIIINLIIVSELFYSFTDFSTPIDSIKEIYQQLLKPYYEIIKQKIKIIYKLIINTGDDLIMRYDDVEPINNNKINRVKQIDHLVNTEPEVEIDKSFNYKDLLLYSAIAFGIYYIFFLPGIDPGDLGNYNSINQALINSKIYIKDISLSVWDYLTSLSSGTPNINNIPSHSASLCGEEKNPIIIGPPSLRNNTLVESILNENSSPTASHSASLCGEYSPSSTASVTPKLNNSALPGDSNEIVFPMSKASDFKKSSPVPGLSFFKNKRMLLDHGIQTETNNNSISVQTDITSQDFDTIVNNVAELNQLLPSLLPEKSSVSVQTDLKALPLGKERNMFKAITTVIGNEPNASNLLNSAQSLIKKITD